MPKALKSVETLAKLLMLVTKLKQTTGLKTRNWACLSKILSLKLNLGSNLRRLVSARAKKCRARSNSKPEYGSQLRSLPSSRSPTPPPPPPSQRSRAQLSPFPILRDQGWPGWTSSLPPCPCWLQATFVRLVGPSGENCCIRQHQKTARK